MDMSKSKMKDTKKGTLFCCMTKLKVFLVALFFAYLAKTMSGAYMASILTQIERRFNIPASLVGVISGSFEMGNLLLMAFVSYLGTKLHRPRMIALGCAVMALGCFLMALPHFLMGRYDYGSTVALSENNSSSMAVCLAHQSQFSMPTEQPSEECEKQAGSLMWVFVLVGNLIRGIGETPIAPLGISYVEDFAKAENSPFYIGCLQIATIVGPLFGLMSASYAAEMFVDVGFMDLEDVTLNLTDARWVGAWWLGILICAGVSLLVAIPFCFLPKSLPKEGEENSAEVATKRNTALLQAESVRPDKEKLSEITKDFIPYLKSLFHNRVYMLFLFITVLQFNADIGMVTFMPKYLEQQFGISASDAIFFIVICAGYFFGGLMMKKFKISTYKAAHLGFWSYLVQYLIYFSAFSMVCKSASVAGLTVSYEGIDQVSYGETSLYAECNRGCGCSAKVWDPVCGENGIAYVSACLAGCEVSNGTGKNTVFENCSCIPASGFPSGNGSAVLGQCDREESCGPMLHYYLILCLVCCLIYSFGAMPGYMVLIRSLKPEEKSFGVGLHTLTERAFAGIPSPIYFGAMIDRTCLKWGTKSCGGEGACRMYNADTYRNFGSKCNKVSQSFAMQWSNLHLQKKRQIPDSDIGLVPCHNTNKERQQPAKLHKQKDPFSKREIKHSMDEKVAQLEAKDNPALMDKSHGSHPAKRICSSVSELKIFLGALAFCFFAKAFSGSYMKSMTTQIERRFEIPSSVVGLIDGSFEIGNLVVLVLVSYLGPKVHRPKAIAVGCLIMSTGALMSAVPHFIMGRYNYQSIAVSVASTSGNISACSSASPSPAHASDDAEMAGNTTSLECGKTTSSYLWLFVLVGNLLRGIGEAPVMPLGMTYIDDFAREENSAFYIGAVRSAGMIGPTLGFLLGSFCANLWVDIGVVDADTLLIDSKDIRWVGAWWLGFLICGTTSIAASLPFWFLPRSLSKQGEDAAVKKKASDVYGITKDSAGKMNPPKQPQLKILEAFKDFFPTVKKLLGNPIYLVYLLLNILQYNSLVGIITYESKFMEQQFDISISKAIFLIGVIVLPITIVATFMGGFIVKKFKLQVMGMAKFTCITFLSAYLFNLLYFASNCEVLQVAGLTVNYSGCFTTVVVWELPDLAIFLRPWASVQGKNVLKSVSPDLKSFAVGIETVSGRILGEDFPLLFKRDFGLEFYARGLPAPIYFGALIDKTCLKWGTPSCGGSGSCRLYDTQAFRNVYVGLVAALRGGCCLLYIVFFVLIVKRFRHESRETKTAQVTEAPSKKLPATSQNPRESMEMSTHEDTPL
ncbi:hypothetical protein lerEdw1_000539 [Lerista edwardsae]|nr:hypothetical protein lerEdw1_000539 [Lerista edwardsae]